MDNFIYNKKNDLDYLLQLEEEKLNISENISIFRVLFLYNNLETLFNIHDSFDNIKFQISYDHDLGFVFTLSGFELQKNFFDNINNFSLLKSAHYGYSTGFVLPKEEYLNKDLYKNRNVYHNLIDIEEQDNFMQFILNENIFTKYLKSKLDGISGTSTSSKINKI